MKKILQQIKTFIAGPEHDKHIMHLDTSLGKGRGFTYKGNEFVHHSELHHFETAFYNLIRRQKFVLGIIIIFLVVAIIINWHVFLIVLFSLLTGLYFLDLLFNAYVIYRTFRYKPELKVSQEEITAAEATEWPTYTIFCPLYKEWQVVPQFAVAMQKLDYPHEKLQIMFLLEENDQETIDKVRAAGLPSYFEIIVVPHSKPKTKPKAMNYGLNYATGEYLVIYDAEDQPEHDQLKKAVLAFRKSTDKVACVQAKLNFYNPTQNILTRIFTAEYSLWFDLVLPGLQSISAPIPLGGTSNHFRTDMLRHLHGWDAFNVTEDCDLGMRLANRGYRTAIVESTTHEEANSDALNWYNQRSRWIKGYIITYLVHMRKPMRAIKEGRGRDLFFFQLIVGGKVVSLFINPIMWASTFVYFMWRAKVGIFIESLFPGPILYVGVFSFVFGNFLYLYYYMIGCANRGYDSIIKYIFLVPFYWIAMSFAAWKAVYEVIVKPHYWAKTKHGLHLTPAQVPAEEVAVTRQTRIAVPKQVVVMQSKAIQTPPPLDQNDRNSPIVKKKQIKTPRYRFDFLSSGASMLVISSVISNFLNFGFNAYLGRELTLEEFGIVTMMNVFAYILSLFIGALSTTVTRTVSYMEGVEVGSSKQFFKNKWLGVLLIGIIGSILWGLAVPMIAGFFQVSTILIIFAFGPVIIFGALNSFNNGYLQGTYSFSILAITALIEVVAKFLIVFLLVNSTFKGYAALAIPASTLCVWIATSIGAWFIYTKNKTRSQSQATHEEFSYGFYFASLISGFSVAAFLSIDVILAKHYLSPSDAGRYSMLSLVGKMIYFFGSLLNVFVVTLVSRSLGKHENPRATFDKIFTGTAFLTISAGLGLGLLGSYLVPLLLGEQARSIVMYVPSYALAIVLFTLSTTIVLYQLTRKKYLFSGISFFMATMMVLDIIDEHESIDSFVRIITNINIIYFSLILFIHVFYNFFIYGYRNIVDILSVVRTLPKVAEPLSGRMKILIFNWRDTESVFAGGAETYIHALASRWVKNGHSVTLFTSNDGKQTQNGEIGGVRIIRRGGFFIVYIAAAIYYLFKFRGKFDVIIDSENGVPFFTPLYAKEPVYCLIHHIHQDVFRRSLIKPLAAFACFLEKTLMPLVYKGSEFITVSESSKRDMEKLSITDKKIHVVYPGVDLSFLSPGIKSPTPLISYVGRLKDYKSVDVLIKAFAKIIVAAPAAQLIIAGDGDERGKLLRLISKLELCESVSLLGKVSEEEKRDIMRRSWVFVNPSMMEGWGITTIEANACGTAVVASDVPGLRDSVADGRTGILVPYGNIDLMAKKIIAMIGDRSFLNDLMKNGIDWASNFDWQKISEKFINIVSKQKHPSIDDEVHFAKNI